MSLSDERAQGVSARLAAVSKEACRRLGIKPVTGARLEDALTQALDVSRLVDNLAETWRTSPAQVRDLLKELGMGAMLARETRPAEDRIETAEDEPDDSWRQWGSGQIRVRCFNPSLRAGGGLAEAVAAFCQGVSSDPFVTLYRDGAGDYHRGFLRDQAPTIRNYVAEWFGADGPEYLINSGIGANEQPNHLVSALHNASPDRKPIWYTVNSVKAMSQVPSDARIENTLFMEFSRSGITEETIKLHEYTPRQARRIVFANSGPLYELGKRDGNLVLSIPAEVSGRFGRNKTPILLAPMLVAGLDTNAYWSAIENVCRTAPLSKADSLPVQLAAYLRTQQLGRGINHIYLATNHPLLIHSADEMCQFWNEGPNKHGNDILMSRYLGLPRDSHMNLEGILANHKNKLAVFLVYTGSELPGAAHPLVNARIDPINPKHAHLSLPEHDLVLTLANLKRCSELMPTVVVTVRDIDLTASALLGQLWADVAFVYSRLVNVDPGSNPEVKAVRTRGSAWLADKTAAWKLLE
jgi:hypothetical protein